METADTNIARVQHVAKSSSDQLLRKFAQVGPHKFSAKEQNGEREKMGMSKAKTRAREMKNKSIITALEKTWGRAVEGASRVLLENHYNRHERLIKDNSC